VDKDTVIARVKTMLNLSEEIEIPIPQFDNSTLTVKDIKIKVTIAIVD
jgi:hypothetical protein